MLAVTFKHHKLRHHVVWIGRNCGVLFVWRRVGVGEPRVIEFDMSACGRSRLLKSSKVSVAVGVADCGFVFRFCEFVIGVAVGVVASAEIRARARAVLFFFLHDLPFVVFIRGDFAEFQTIPERVSEVKVGTIFLFFFGSFGALGFLDAKDVVTAFFVFIAAYIVVAHIAADVENFAGVVFLFFFFVVFG